MNLVKPLQSSQHPACTMMGIPLPRTPEPGDRYGLQPGSRFGEARGVIDVVNGILSSTFGIYYLCDDEHYT